MKVELQWEGDSRFVLVCAGDLGWDANDILIKKASEAFARRGGLQMVLDLEDVDCVTSAGIGVLLQLRSQAAEQDGSIMIICPSPAIRQLFKTVGLDRHIPVFHDWSAFRDLVGEAG
ncbi:MAG: STAS domain-containing protein [Planctomycetes bacterium]|nr:STAS domain-containing protein [Planctomycetota bacterium]